MISEKPIISIGLPFYNARATILDCVTSILNQTLTAWELIAVDDGSTDGSAELVATIHDSRVRLVRDGHNLGLAVRLNQLADLATGEYLARMDADDIMHSERLDRQVEYLKSHPDTDVVGSYAYVIDDHNTIKSMRRLDSHTASYLDSVVRSIFIHPTVLARTAWFRANKYSTSTIRAEDHELWCRTFEASRFLTINVPLLYYRESDQFPKEKQLQSLAADRHIYVTYGVARLGWLPLVKPLVLNAMMVVLMHLPRAVRTTILGFRRSDLTLSEALLQGGRDGLQDCLSPKSR